MLLDRLDGNVRVQPTTDLDLHMKECQACREWYQEQESAAAALEKLQPYQVSTDFTARVIARLSPKRTSPDPAGSGQSNVFSTLQKALGDLSSRLSTPVGRRRLTPTLVTVAAVLVVAVCLFAIVQGVGVPVTPGAAAGSSTGLVLVGGIIVAALAVLGLLLLRRK